MTVCISEGIVVCAGTGSTLQTICATGSGETFSRASSTIASSSVRSHLGNCATRRKTLPVGSHARLSRLLKSARQFLATWWAGRGSAGRPENSSSNSASPSPAMSKCQSRRRSAERSRTLQALGGEGFTRAVKGFAPEEKFQIQSSKLQRSSKSQAPIRRGQPQKTCTRPRCHRSFGIWNLELLWCLELGAWSFAAHAPTEN